MEVTAVRQGLADAADAIEGLICTPRTPDSPEEPAFFPRRTLIEFDSAMGRGLDRITATCVLLVSRADDEAGQEALEAYLAGAGPRSLKAALQSDRTLGGACRTLRLVAIDSHKMITVGVVDYFGAEVTVDIYG